MISTGGGRITGSAGVSSTAICAQRTTTGGPSRRTASARASAGVRAPSRCARMSLLGQCRLQGAQGQVVHLLRHAGQQHGAVVAGARGRGCVSGESGGHGHREGVLDLDAGVHGLPSTADRGHDRADQLLPRPDRALGSSATSRGSARTRPRPGPSPRGPVPWRWRWPFGEAVAPGRHRRSQARPGSGTSPSSGSPSAPGRSGLGTGVPRWPRRSPQGCRTQALRSARRRRPARRARSPRSARGPSRAPREPHRPAPGSNGSAPLLPGRPTAAPRRARLPPVIRTPAS